MEQILDIGEYGSKVRLDGGRLAIYRTDGKSSFVPLRDVAVLMLSEPCMSISAAVLSELAKSGSTAVVCDGTHTPVGIFQPMAAHSRATADAVVHDWLTANPSVFDLSPAFKRYLLKALLASRWRTSQGIVPLFAALSRAAVSLRECLLNDKVELEVPVQVEEEEDVDACAV